MNDVTWPPLLFVPAARAKVADELADLGPAGHRRVPFDRALQIVKASTSDRHQPPLGNPAGEYLDFPHRTFDLRDPLSTAPQDFDFAREHCLGEAWRSKVMRAWAFIHQTQTIEL